MLPSALPITHLFADDGRIPNNPKLPLVLYRGGIDLAGSPDPEKLIEKTFAANGWGNMWRNGIYPYVHYHSMIHEVMGIARGRATVRFGGEKGEEIESRPATSSSCRPAPGTSASRTAPTLWSSAPIRRAANTISAAAARPSTPRRSPPSAKCRCPPTDPVFGAQGPLTGAVAGMSSGWLTFWDSSHSIYVNARHRDVHYSLIAQQIAALVPSPQARVLDYGCGEALHADLVAAAAGELLLCEGAPRVRAGIAARFAGIAKIRAVAPDEVERVAEHSLDLIVLHSVAQYLKPEELATCSRCFIGC